MIVGHHRIYSVLLRVHGEFMASHKSNYPYADYRHVVAVRVHKEHRLVGLYPPYSTSWRNLSWIST